MAVVTALTTTPADWQMTIDTLAMGAGTVYETTSFWDGFGAQALRTGDQARGFASGSFVGYDWLDERTVQWKLTINEDSPADAMMALDALLSVWQVPEGDSSTTKLLGFKVPGRTVQFWSGRPRRATPDMTLLPWGRIDVAMEFIATDPRIYEVPAQSVTLGAGGAMTTFTPGGTQDTFPLITITIGSPGVTALALLHNFGTAPGTTAEIQLEPIGAASGTITIDGQARTITGAGSGVMLGQIWPMLKANGTTQIGVLPTLNTGGTVTSTVKWNPARRG